MAALREAGRMLLAGETLGRVARWLTDHGPAPRRTAAWSRQTARQALLGPAHGSLFGSADSRAVRGLLGVLGDRHAPPQSAPNRRPARLLSGVLLCSGCGRPLVVSSLRGGRVLYRCNSRSRVSGVAVCPRGVVAIADAVEGEVSRLWLEGWGPHAETVTVTLADEAAARLATAEDEVSRLVDLLSTVRGAERRALLGELEAAEDVRDALAGVSVSRVSVLRETGRTFGEAFAAGSVEDRRDLLVYTAGRLLLGPGVPGRHGFDVSRLPDSWRLDPAGVPPE